MQVGLIYLLKSSLHYISLLFCIYYRLGSSTCQGDEHLAQAGTKCVSRQHGTAQVTSGSLVILNWNHAVDVGEVGHLCGCHYSIVDLLMGWDNFKETAANDTFVPMIHNKIYSVFKSYWNNSKK